MGGDAEGGAGGLTEPREGCRDRPFEGRETFAQFHHAAAQPARGHVFAGVERGDSVGRHVEAAGGALVGLVVALQQLRRGDVLAALVGLISSLDRVSMLRRPRLKPWAVTGCMPTAASPTAAKRCATRRRAQTPTSG